MITLYASLHGHARQVAERLPNPHNVELWPSLDGHDFHVFVCPTYGDEELPLAMEDYLYGVTKRDGLYTAVELGNYYEDFRFGALNIIKSRLTELGWREAYPSLSLDSLPTVDWDVFERWRAGWPTEMR